MVDIGFIGLGHMGFPMARRRRSQKRNTWRGCSRTSASNLDEAKALGVPVVEISEAVARLWGATLKDEGATPFSRPRASLSATPKSENDIIDSEEQHYSHRVRLWPLSGAINNRNAYGKPVD